MLRRSTFLFALFLCLILQSHGAKAQVDWVKSGKDWLRLWKAGRIDLQDPSPRSGPLVLQVNDKRVQALVKAKGRYWFWSHANELSFICSGLAADVTGEGRKVLVQMAAQVAPTRPGKQLLNKKSLRMQPWMLRTQARKSLARLGDQDVRAYFSNILKTRAKQKVAEARLRILATQVLAECGDYGDVATLLPGLTDGDALLRAASARAVGRITGEPALEALIERLAKESDPSVRVHLWAGLVPATEALGTWKERRNKEIWKDLCAKARTILLAAGTPTSEKIALCRWLWRVRPDLLLPVLPKALGAAQGAGPGMQRLRWWLQGNLIDMIGSGFYRSRKGKAAADPGPTDAQAWQERLDAKARPVPMNRRHRLKHPPYPKESKKLFGLPLQGQRLLILLDVSAPFAGPLVPESSRRPKAGASKTKVDKEDRRTQLGEDIRRQLQEVLDGLPATTELRIVAYSKKRESLPRKGYLSLGKKGRSRIRAFLDKQTGAGDADPSSPLLDAIGQVQALPAALAPEEGPDAIYWLAISPPLAGPVRSSEALTDLCAASNSLWTVPLFIAWFPDRRSLARRKPLYQFGFEFSRNLTRLSEESMGAFENRSYSPGK